MFPDCSAEKTDYDVFPKGSWVGLYFKTRHFDFSKVKTFSIDARQVPGKNSPDYVRIEFKTKFSIVRTFALKMIRENWQTFSFPISFSKETPITEVTMMFTHDKVGPNKTGSVQFKNFNFEADTEKPSTAVVAAPTQTTAPAAAVTAKAPETEAPAASNAQTPQQTTTPEPSAPPAVVGDPLEFK